MKQIIVNCGSKETRIALLDEGRLMELFIEHATRQRLVGSIYKGKVANVLPGMQAAFIDIGTQKNAFLYIDDCLSAEQKEIKEKGKPTIREVLTEGQELLVQVTKEPYGTKGARVTTQISFPGRFLVYMPEDPYIGISRKIEKEEERVRLHHLAEEFCKEKEGVIIRTLAEGASAEELKADFLFLRGIWQGIIQVAKESKTRTLIHQDLDLVPRIARDMLTPEVDEFVIDNFSEYTALIKQLEFAIPGLKEKVKHYNDRINIFDAYEIEGEIEKALKRKVWLKSGGYLVIDQTEALTSIDVNTGKFTGSHNLEETVFKTNIEAAREIARQLQLRDIGGIIIIDFIDMAKNEHRDAVWRSLNEALKKDRTKSHVLGFTQLGLLEMTRKKARQNLTNVLMRPCPYCEGRGKILKEDSVIAKIDREIREYAQNSDVEAILVELHPVLTPLLIGQNGINLERIKKEWGVKIYVKENDELHQECHHLAFVGTEEEVKRRAMGISGQTS